MANVPTAFKIIIQHFSDQTLCQSQREIYNRVRAFDQAEGSDPVTCHCVIRTLRYLKDFGFIEKPDPRCCWHIKSVDEMCDRLHALDNNIGNDGQCLTVSIAFEIIIHEFSGDTVWRSTTDIKKRVFKVHQDQKGLPKYAVKDPVGWTLRFLNHFGLAEKTGHSDWRIKSVGDMCAWLHAL